MEKREQVNNIRLKVGTSYEDIKGILARRVASLRQVKQYLPECLSEEGYKTLEAYEIVTNASITAINIAEWRDSLERIVSFFHKHPGYEVYGYQLNEKIVQVIREFVSHYLY